MFLWVFMSVFGNCIDCPLAFSGACPLLLVQQDTTLGGYTLPTPPQTADSTATQTKVTFELRRKQHTLTSHIANTTWSLQNANKQQSAV